MAITVAHINKSVLKWARSKSGFAAVEVATRIRIKPEKYESWEDLESDAKPTIKQLRKLAHMFRRPVSLFYLSEPPVSFDPMRDLRRQQGGTILTYSPALLHQMEIAQQRREFAIELHREMEYEIDPLTINANLSDDPEVVGSRIRKILEIRFEDQAKWFRISKYEAFNSWRKAIESLDVLVFQFSNVERYETSGFAVSQQTLPVIAVNRKDYINRRTFSLLHEFVHILLGISGTSNLELDVTRPPEEQRIEVFCNRAAAAALMPSEIVLSLPIVKSNDSILAKWSDEAIRNACEPFGVSREAFLRRLLTFDLITKKFYKDKRLQYKADFEEFLNRQKEEFRKSKKEFRKNPPQDAIAELGRPYIRLLFAGIRQDLLTLNKASDRLGNLRVRHFPGLEKKVYGG